MNVDEGLVRKLRDTLDESEDRLRDAGLWKEDQAEKDWHIGEYRQFFYTPRPKPWWRRLWLWLTKAR